MEVDTNEIIRRNSIERKVKDMNENDIIKYAMKSIGATNICQLDGMTIFINDICYNIYVNDGKVDIDII